MKTVGTLFAALALTVSATFALPAYAAEFTKGVVKKIDTKAKKVTIDHEDLKNLDMPAMTMVFRADDAVLAKLKEGAAIEFVADRVNGNLTVTEVK
ncbi:copper-binding protein (plasmid) [Ensifer sp. PDNC004]|uniref:copper-binding protein n=1 Tax=Ensifer sp. PDNC004 TaxID=2811423 RepID=UPI0019661DA1|nr:copper-binding protein [Ensifer sp. PDNC004]QRY65911.1 copper-binding protein [Ensifer sp. PDNC004]